jgi:hypothetical protein
MEALYNIFVESVKETVMKLRDLAALRPDFELKTVQKNALGEIINFTAPQISSHNVLTSSNKKNQGGAAA